MSARGAGASPIGTCGTTADAPPAAHAGVLVRPLAPADWPAVERIYREGISSGHATFEPEPPSWARFDATRRPDLRLVAERDGGVVGWAAASPVSPREAYAGVVEHSVYVAASAQGGGIGRMLLVALLEAADAAGVWTVQASVFPENTASLALHAAAGFRRVGVRERIARMPGGPLAGTWRDTVLLERRRPLPDAAAECTPVEVDRKRPPVRAHSRSEIET